MYTRRCASAIQQLRMQSNTERKEDEFGLNLHHIQYSSLLLSDEKYCQIGPLKTH